MKTKGIMGRLSFKRRLEEPVYTRIFVVLWSFALTSSIYFLFTIEYFRLLEPVVFLYALLLYYARLDHRSLGITESRISLIKKAIYAPKVKEEQEGSDLSDHFMSMWAAKANGVPGERLDPDEYVISVQDIAEVIEVNARIGRALYRITMKSGKVYYVSGNSLSGIMVHLE
jgi:hypothetical protein